MRYGKWLSQGEGASFPVGLVIATVLVPFTVAFGCFFFDWVGSTHPAMPGFFVFLITSAVLVGVLVGDALVFLMITYFAYLFSEARKELRRTKAMKRPVEEPDLISRRL